MADVWDGLTPHQRKELAELLLKRAKRMEVFNEDETTTAWAIRCTKAAGWRECARFIETEGRHG